eukprot:330446-Pleurochrysis_carterae.AAC.1
MASWITMRLLITKSQMHAAPMAPTAVVPAHFLYRYAESMIDAGCGRLFPPGTAGRRADG